MTTSSNQPTKKEPQRHAEHVAALRMAVLYSAGITEPGTREAAFSGGPLPLLVGEYVAKIRSTASYRITEEDIQHSHPALTRVAFAWEFISGSPTYLPQR